MSDSSSSTPKSKTVCALGSYNELAIFVLPISAHLVRLCNISSNDNVLDVACGTGNTAITARRRGAKVTGVDFTPELLSQAKVEASLAEADDNEWKEGNVEDPPPFEDGSFDVVVSSFGHMFVSNPEVYIKEMLRVTKSGGGGRIAFSTWPSELVNGKLFEVMTKHAPPPPQSPNSPPLRCNGEFQKLYKSVWALMLKILILNVELLIYQY